jgi:cardiolipin synthase
MVLWSWWLWATTSIASALLDHWGWALGFALLSFVCYLLAPTEFAPSYGLKHDFDADSDEFFDTMAGATGVPFIAGNRIDVLCNGDRFYPAMLDAIAQARHSITVEAYIYWAGNVGRRFADALAERARSGVTVKILLDAVGSATIGDEIVRVLESGGCEMAWYNPIRWYSIGRFNHRTHRKSLIVDGRVGFTGGAGIADLWLGNAEDPDHWRDTQIRIEGPAVVPLQTGFAQNWLATTGELLSGLLYYPHQHQAGRLAAQTIMSSPETGASSVRIMYYLSILAAVRSIHIANPYFVPDHAALQSLVEASRRGVRVRIMVAGSHNDNWWARHNSIRLYGALLEAGVEILEYNQTMLHHKLMVVDGLWATIGTTNFDNRSFAHNEESNVCLRDREFAAVLESSFESDALACRRVVLDEWRRRGVIEKLRGLAAWILQDQV